MICVDPTLEHDNVRMITGADVRRLETDPTGRTVTQVVAELEGGSTARFAADIVVVACGAVNSAALLLRSASDTHPNGLGNSSDVVGRLYMRHNNLALMAVSREPNPTRFQKTLALNDWYLGSEDFDFPMGGIQMLGKSDAEQIRGEAPRWAGKVSPDMPFEVLAHHAVDLWLCREDLPPPDSPVTLDGDGRLHLSIDEKNNMPGLTKLPGTGCRRCSGGWGCIRTTCWTTASICTRACRSGPPHTRPARFDSVRIPGVRRWTSTAGPMNWTTSTSSTPASSRASAR